MASPVIFDAVQAHLAAFTAAPLVYENDPWPDQDTPSPFVLVEVFGDYYAQESFGAPGANLWRESVTILAHVMVPNDTGSRAARVLARAFADLFREPDLPDYRVIDMSIGAGEAGDEEANYWRMTVRVGLEHDD